MCAFVRTQLDTKQGMVATDRNTVATICHQHVNAWLPVCTQLTHACANDPLRCRAARRRRKRQHRSLQTSATVGDAGRSRRCVLPLRCTRCCWRWCTSNLPACSWAANAEHQVHPSCANPPSCSSISSPCCSLRGPDRPGKAQGVRPLWRGGPEADGRRRGRRWQPQRHLLTVSKAQL